MIKEIIPISRSINARISVPGSKSITNRALVCAALARGESVIRNASDSTDTAMMANGLNQLGVLVRKQGDTLTVDGTGGKLYAPKFPIPVGNAGTTLRFMLSLGALAAGKTVFEGSDRMAERPIADLLGALSQLGVQASATGIIPRFTVEGGSFVGGNVKLKAEKSSQFLSSLLMVSPYAQREVAIAVEGQLSSQSYVEMTIEVMKAFGVEVRRPGADSFTVEAKRNYHTADFHIEPDASGASYFLAAAAILSGEVLIEGMRLKSLQGDAMFVSVLEKMGCSVQETDEGVRLRSDGTLHGIDVDMNSMPDVVPTLAVTALFANSPTRIRNVAHLRHKESDRLDALTELQKLGAQVTILADGLEIRPAALSAAQLDTYDDHRLAMSFALVGLKTPGVRIVNPDCVKKSFPKFWSEWEKLYSESLEKT